MAEGLDCTIQTPDQGDGAMLVSEFPRVEAFRRELRALPFVRLNDAELAHLRARLFVGHHNNAIEGIEPSPEMAALCEMFLQERAPLHASEPFVDRFFQPQSSQSARAG